MVFITLYCLNTLKRLRSGMGLCLVLFACFYGLPAQATGLESRNFSLSLVDDNYELNASFELEISPFLEKMLERGVTLSFKAEFELLQARWYWLDERVVKKTQTVQLSYHPLTRQYRVASGQLQQTYPSLRQALRKISRIHAWPVAERKDLKFGQAYQLSFRYFLDISQLPKPLQITAFTQGDWQWSSPTIERSFTPESR